MHARPWPLLLRAVGGHCTLSCEHCFLPAEGSKPEVMTQGTLERTLEQYQQAVRGGLVIVQGLEPLQAGLAWFRRLEGLLRSDTGRSLQTAGVHLDSEWCDLLKCGEWTVGLSHDGPDNSGRGVETGLLDSKAAMLLRAGIPFSMLCTVTRKTMGTPEATIRHLAALGPHVQFIAAKASAPGLPAPGPTGLEFRAYLDAALSCANVERLPVVIDNFNAAGLAWDREPTTCEVEEDCGSYLVVDHRGDVFPCDFYHEPEWRLGSVHGEASLGDIFERSQRMADFRRLKHLPAPGCEACSMRPACGRGCPRDRYLAGDPSMRSPMCEAHYFAAEVTQTVGTPAPRRGAESPRS